MSEAAQPLTLHTAAERPDLWERGVDSASVWPEYNLHGDVVNRWWPLLDEEMAEYQFVLYEASSDTVVAEGHTAPMRWDGDEATLPPSFDAAIALAFEQLRAGVPADTLCALAAESPRESRGRGIAERLLVGMREIAQRHGLRRFVAPVRPSWKERYPLTSIERYVTWRRQDGQLLDPWMRIHERLGARVSTPLPRSLRITGSVAEWERWTAMAFPESGDYVFPAGLATVHIDCEADLGSYWEPNVWMVHPER
ncbi:MAG TPA: hypothetical protein VF071_13650 [Candidatus Limnocylindria bacterium]